MKAKKYPIRYDKPILHWDEALPLGNGKMGALLYGDGPIRLSLDRVNLWDKRVHPATLEEGFSYSNLVRLSTSGREEDWQERDRLFEKVYDEFSYPSKITAGRIELDFQDSCEKMQGEVDIETAIGTLAFREGRIETFLHATRFVGVARVRGDFKLNLHIPDYISGSGRVDQSQIGDGGTMHPKEGCGYPRAEICREDGFTYYHQETQTEFSYGVVIYEVRRTAEDQGLVTELYYTIETNEDGEDFIEKAKVLLKEVSEVGYENLCREHMDWWRTYWTQSEIDVGDELIERTYYRSMYLFASCSRKGYHPMPLQGVWTADNDALPPWRGDYHHDTNTQLSYQSYLKGNHLQEGEAFLDYLWALKPQFETVAKEFYGVEGLLIPGVSTIDGKPMGGWAQYALSPTMSIWTAQSFDEYYLYTGDENFLKERAFPFLEGVAKGIRGILKEKNGKLFLPLSTSPEIHDATPEAYLKPNSNFDLALMRYLFGRMGEYCRILGKDPSIYDETLSKLEEIHQIDGYISLSRDERLQESHRHFSHLMCLYPLHLINYDTKEHREVYHKAIEEIERLGMGMWVGFSYAMCAQIYAMAEMGNASYEKLRQFADGFVADNGFHLNGDFKHKGYSTFHYRPFTLESLFGYCDALQEMLLQEHQGYVHVFPAIPEEWKKRRIEFHRLRSYGGILVSAVCDHGSVTDMELLIPRKCQIRIKNVFSKEYVILEKEMDGARILRETAGYFEFEAEAGTWSVRG